MKKVILIALAFASISGFAYAATTERCETAGRLTKNLNLDEVRAAEVEQILSSYMQVKELASNGQYMEIPAFIEARQAQLAEVLSDAEMQQFQENVGEWAGAMAFSKHKGFSKHMGLSRKYGANFH